MLLLPIVPFLSAVGMAVSACTAVWYRSLTKDEKERANQEAATFAKQIYKNCFGKISGEERIQDIGKSPRLS